MPRQQTKRKTPKQENSAPPAHVFQGPLENSAHESFCVAFVSGKTITQSAIDAGYSATAAAAHGSRMLKRPDIKARIAQLREMHGLDLDKPAKVDRQWVLNSLVRNVENALAANDRGAANRGLELLGREYGLFTERRIEMNSPLEGLTAEQLLALLGAADRLEEGLIDVTPAHAEPADNDVSSEDNGLAELPGYIVPNPSENLVVEPLGAALPAGSGEAPRPPSPAGAGGAGAGPGLDTPPSPPPSDAPQGLEKIGEGLGR